MDARPSGFVCSDSLQASRSQPFNHFRSWPPFHCKKCIKTFSRSWVWSWKWVRLTIRRHDGQTERVHRTIQEILRAVINHRQRSWEELLPICEFAYNDMVGSSPCETPFFLNHGHHPVTVDRLLSVPQPQTSSAIGREWLERQQETVRLVKDRIKELWMSRCTTQTNADGNPHSSRKEITVTEVLVHRDFMSTPASQEQECSKLAPR